MEVITMKEFQVSGFQKFLMKNAIVQLFKFIGNTLRIMGIAKKI